MVYCSQKLLKCLENHQCIRWKYWLKKYPTRDTATLSMTIFWLFLSSVQLFYLGFCTVFLSVCLLVWSVCLSSCLSLFMSASVFSICLMLCLFVCFSVGCLSACLQVYLFNCLSVMPTYIVVPCLSFLVYWTFLVHSSYVSPIIFVFYLTEKKSRYSRQQIRCYAINRY